jgi:hypothetical protein
VVCSKKGPRGVQEVRVSAKEGGKVSEPDKSILSVSNVLSSALK